MKIIILLFVLAPHAFSSDIHREEKFLTKSVSGVDITPLKAPNVKLQVHRNPAYASELPNIKERNAIFLASGLSEATENWDDFEKDSLYLKLERPGSAPIERILKKHPELKREALEQAQKMIASKISQ